jgi:hypothetical protein
MRDKSSYREIFARRRIEFLMWAFVAEVLASPFADTHPHAGAALGLVLLAMLLFGIRGMANITIIRRVVIPISLIWLLARLLEAFGDRTRPYANLSPIVGLAFSCAVLVAIFNHLHTHSHNLRSAVAEAFISYLIIATAFSQLYWILNHFTDHAFSQTIPPNQSATFLYFSMVALTSVGYGGIAPVDPYVRLIAAFESMCGVFFVAVVVARLVSTFQSRTLASQIRTGDTNIVTSLSLVNETEPGV